MKKIVRISESEFKKILKGVVKEALGVPSGILDTSEKIYLDIVQGIQKNYNGGSEEFSFTINKQYGFSDYKIDSITIDFEIFEHEKANKPEVLSMGVPFESKLQDDKFNLEVVSDFNNPTMSMTIVIPKGYSKNDLINFLIKEKVDIISSVSHETKHLYDTFKKKIDIGAKRAEYSAYSNLKFGIMPIDYFIHNLYFVHSVENLVRPTEVASLIKQNKVLQKDFLKFLLNNDVYKKLIDIKNFSYEKLVKELYNSMPEIDKFYERTGIDGGETDEEKVQELLRLVYVNLINAKGSAYKELLTSNFLEDLVGFDGKKESIFRKFINKIQNFKTLEDFFKYEEKLFRFVADKMIRKISKLYAIIEKEKSSN